MRSYVRRGRVWLRKIHVIARECHFSLFLLWHLWLIIFRSRGVYAQLFDFFQRVLGLLVIPVASFLFVSRKAGVLSVSQVHVARAVYLWRKSVLSGDERIALQSVS